MKKRINKWKIRIKRLLIIKIAELRKEIKTYKERITDDVIKEREYIDKITLLEGEIRDLKLKIKDLEKWKY